MEPEDVDRQLAEFVQSKTLAQIKKWSPNAILDMMVAAGLKWKDDATRDGVTHLIRPVGFRLRNKRFVPGRHYFLTPASLKDRLVAIRQDPSSISSSTSTTTSNSSNKYDEEEEEAPKGLEEPAVLLSITTATNNNAENKNEEVTSLAITTSNEMMNEKAAAAGIPAETGQEEEPPLPPPPTTTTTSSSATNKRPTTSPPTAATTTETKKRKRTLSDLQGYLTPPPLPIPRPVDRDADNSEDVGRATTYMARPPSANTTMSSSASLASPRPPAASAARSRRSSSRTDADTSNSSGSSSSPSASDDPNDPTPPTIEELAKELIELSTHPHKRQGVHRITDLLRLTEIFQQCVRDIQVADSETKRHAVAYMIAATLLPVRQEVGKALLARRGL